MVPSGLCELHRVDRFAIQNRFQELYGEQECEDEDEEEDIFTGVFCCWSVGHPRADKIINGVGRTQMLVSVGRGKVTVDSGPAESVMPRDTLQHDALVEGRRRKSGVKCVAANVSKMVSCG